MTKISATIVADSLAPSGNRLTTMLVTFPRFILAELNTHRMLSKNSASSRAIPFEKMVKSVQENPFIPIAWQKDHSGMQGTEYHADNMDIALCTDNWLEARNNAIRLAKALNEKNATKQLCNRLLEPFMWHTVLISGTEWENFFNLRCPQYTFHNDDSEKDFVFKSKKETRQLLGNQPVEYPEGNVMLDDLSDLQWLKLNQGQAEIHMMALAESMWDAYNESKPKKLKAGDWHIPYEDNISLDANDWKFTGKDHWGKDMTDYLIKVSTAMCARTSYTIVGEEKEVSYETLLNIHDRMATQVPFHASPFEHCAKVMSEDEIPQYLKGKAKWDYGTIENYKQVEGWCRNYKGFIQYRELLEDR